MFHKKTIEPPKIPSKVIEEATENFSGKYLVREGEFGKEYEAEIVHSEKKTLAVIKRFPGMDDLDFMVERMRAFQSKERFCLLGYCEDSGEKVLVFDHAAIKYMSDMKQFEDRKIQLKVVTAATNNFSDETLVEEEELGGKVYKGEIDHPKKKRVVAVKRLSGMGDPKFFEEVRQASQDKKSRFSFMGYCDDCGEKILVFEYAPIKNTSQMEQFEHLKMALKVVKAATKNFSDECLVDEEELGGKVYKGAIFGSKGKKVVAVKRLSGMEDPQFFEEVRQASQHKRSRFSFMGYCDDCGEKVLVFRYRLQFGFKAVEAATDTYYCVQRSLSSHLFKNEYHRVKRSDLK